MSTQFRFHKFVKFALAAVALALMVTTASFSAAMPVSARTVSALQTPAVSETAVKQVAFGLNGEWAVLYGLNGYSTSGLADPVLKKLGELNEAGEEIQWMSFGPDGAWLISSAKSFYFDKLPKELQDEIDRLIKAGAGNEIKYVSFAPKGGWVVVWGTNGYTVNGVPQTAIDEIKKLNADAKEIKQLTFDSNGEWVIVYGKNGLVWSAGISEKLIAQLKKLNEAGEDIRQVSLTPDDGTSGIGYFILYGKDAFVFSNLPKTFGTELKKIDPSVELTN